MLKHFRIIAALFVCCGVNAQTSNSLRVNDLQMIGTHNSYHAGIPTNLMKLLKRTDPGFASLQDYVHPSLERQLDEGVRQLELDVYSDSKGGLYASPAGPRLVAEAGLPADPPFDPQGLMKKPGFKVIHVQGLDYISNCQPFTACLAAIRNWSKSHPKHLPVFVLLEMKTDHWKDFMVQPEPITSTTFDQLDKTLLSVFHRSELITPDDVRGQYSTLEEAILARGWPRLKKARGKVIFLLDQRQLSALYAMGHPSLRGRIIFSNAEPGTPEGAFIEVNDPIQDHDQIVSLIKRGYLVRTMTDSVPSIVDANDIHRREAGMTSGAQILSTDHPFDDVAPSGYVVRFPNGIVRCNPVLTNTGCSASALRE